MHASTPARPESADRPMGPHRARTDHSGDSALRRRTTMRRFENLSLRLRLLCSFGLVLLLLAVVALVAVHGATSQNRLSDERTGLARVPAATQDIRFYNGDVSGWQYAVAYEAESTGKALPDDSVNRAGQLADKAKLDHVLTAFPLAQATPREQELVRLMKADWTEFWRLDDQ